MRRSAQARPADDPPVFVFHHEWLLADQPEVVFAALADVQHYPAWWPQIRSVIPRGFSDPDRGTARVRSFLPVSLLLQVTREAQDPGRGLLRVALVGDLLGWSQWSLQADRGGTRARFDQEVMIGPSAGWALRVLSRRGRAGRAVLTANHAWMMRCGRRGLRRYLAAGGSGGPDRT